MLLPVIGIRGYAQTNHFWKCNERHCVTGEFGAGGLATATTGVGVYQSLTLRPGRLESSSTTNNHLWFSLGGQSSTDGTERKFRLRSHWSLKIFEQ